MQLDDLKRAWAAHGSALERSLAIDERLVRELLLRKVRFALMPYVLYRALEAALGLAAMFASVHVLAGHFAEPRYVLVGGALAVFLSGAAAMSAHLLVKALNLDYDGPVLSIQRDVERIRLAEYRALKWALFGGVVIWLPAALVLYEALSGVDALARIDLLWLAGNLVVGFVILAVGQKLSKKYVERSELGPWARRVVDAASGRALRSASDRLAELARFEREPQSS